MLGIHTRFVPHAGAAERMEWQDRQHPAMIVALGSDVVGCLGRGSGRSIWSTGQRPADPRISSRPAAVAASVADEAVEVEADHGFGDLAAGDFLCGLVRPLAARDGSEEVSAEAMHRPGMLDSATSEISVPAGDREDSLLDNRRRSAR